MLNASVHADGEAPTSRQKRPISVALAKVRCRAKAVDYASKAELLAAELAIETEALEGDLNPMLGAPRMTRSWKSFARGVVPRLFHGCSTVVPRLFHVFTLVPR